MDLYAMLQYGVFVLIVTALVYPVGGYLARVFGGESTWLDPGLRPLERVIYRLGGVDAQHEMDWKEYASAFLVFSLAGTFLLYAILRVQPILHTFDPVYQPVPLSPDLALNTAISFVTTTTWQAYSGENTMSYVSQIVGLVVQNFLAGAAGLAVGIAFIRGLARERTTGLGNFWVDLTRATLWVLLPLSLLGGLLLVWQGVPANVKPYQVVPLVQPTSYQQPRTDSSGNPVTDPSGNPIIDTVQVTQQVIPQGPVAALEFIKNLGTNGGGFFNANGAHPYENPTPLTNLHRDAGDCRTPGGADQYLWPHDQASTRRLAAVRRHGGALHCWLGAVRLGRAGWQPAPRPGRRRGPAPHRRAAGRQYGRERNALWHRRLGADGHHHV